MRRDVVILENGSRWPSWLEQRPLDCVEIVTQRPGEDLTQLARRVVEQLASGSLQPASATLVCGPLGGELRNRTRTALLRALLTGLSQAGGGHVMLAADGAPEQRRELACIAAALDREMGDDPRIWLRFRAQPRPGREAAGRRVA